MLEVHLPHKTIESIREFFYHLFTITCGLLIAVSIERFVEWRHHQDLVAEARETLRLEIERNAKQTDDAIVDIAKDLERARDGLALLAKVRQPTSETGKQDADLRMHASGMHLRDTAWRTAQATGAVNFLSYAEAQRYSTIYSAQEDLMAQQRPIMDDTADWTGLIHKLGLHDGNDVTPAQAAELAEVYARWQAHLIWLHVMARSAAEKQHAFLEGREPQESFSADLD